ncbi:hypothetical protein [Campylobacter jejuni]|uniref:hypothetical protein n=1 Tax=Campylobacter jejuni TaxID=197 RepID=UPI00313EFFA0
MENFKDLLNQLNDCYNNIEKNKQNMFNYIKDNLSNKLKYLKLLDIVFIEGYRRVGINLILIDLEIYKRYKNEIYLRNKKYNIDLKEESINSQILPIFKEKNTDKPISIIFYNITLKIYANCLDFKKLNDDMNTLKQIIGKI